MAPPIRVLHAIHDFLPRHAAGSEIYVADLCAALAARGHHPAVLCAEFDPARRHAQLTWRVHGALPVVEVVNNWHVAEFSETYQSPILDRALAHVLDILQPHVLHVHSLLNLSFGLPALARGRGAAVAATIHDYTLVCPSGGQRVHRAERHVCRTIDVERCARCFPQSPFHTQLMVGRLTRAPGGRGAGLAAARMRRVAPRLTTWLGRSLERAPAPGLDAHAVATRLDAARRTFADIDIAVAPSESLARSFRALGFPTDRLTVSDYGFPPLGRLPSRAHSTGRLRVGFAGTLVWHKGVDLLIDALRHLPADRVEALIFGDAAVFPDYAQQLRRLARGLPVRFMGRYDRGDLSRVFGQMDVLAVPSRWLENSPLVIHEAFMSGVPVVGASIGGITDLVVPEVTGLLFAPDCAEGLAGALRRLLEAPALLDALRSTGPVVKAIDEDAREWEERYRQIIVGAGRAVPTGPARPRAEAAS